MIRNKFNAFIWNFAVSISRVQLNSNTSIQDLLKVGNGKSQFSSPFFLEKDRDLQKKKLNNHDHCELNKLNYFLPQTEAASNW